jgi:hypothetical protein
MRAMRMKNPFKSAKEEPNNTLDEESFGENDGENGSQL